MSFQIRVASADELATVFRLRYEVMVEEVGSHSFPMSRVYIDGRSIHDGDTFPSVNFVVISGDQIVGGAALYFNGEELLQHRAEWQLDRLEKEFAFPITRAQEVAEARRLFVISAARGNGFGALLIKALEVEFASRGGKVLLSAVKEGNYPSLNIIKRGQWTPCGESKGSIRFLYFAKPLSISE